MDSDRDHGGNAVPTTDGYNKDKCDKNARTLRSTLPGKDQIYNYTYFSPFYS